MGGVRGWMMCVRCERGRKSGGGLERRAGGWRTLNK